jgi:hypothetical protein
MRSKKPLGNFLQSAGWIDPLLSPTKVIRVHVGGPKPQSRSVPLGFFKPLPQYLEGVDLLAQGTTGRPNPDFLSGAVENCRKDVCLKNFPESSVAKEATDGHRQQLLAFISELGIPLQSLKIFLDVAATAFLHVTAKTFLYPLSHLAVSVPREVEAIEKLTKLFIVHSGFRMDMVSLLPHYRKYSLSPGGRGLG